MTMSVYLYATVQSSCMLRQKSWLLGVKSKLYFVFTSFYLQNLKYRKSNTFDKIIRPLKLLLPVFKHDFKQAESAKMGLERFLVADKNLIMKEKQCTKCFVEIYDILKAHQANSARQNGKLVLLCYIISYYIIYNV